MCQHDRDPYCPIDDDPEIDVTLEQRLQQLQRDHNLNLDEALETLWRQAAAP